MNASETEPFDAQELQRARQRLSESIAAFWAGGAGSTHDQLNRLFEIQGVDLKSLDAGSSKSKRVASVLARCSDDLFWPLAETLIEELLGWWGWPIDEDFFFSEGSKPSMEQQRESDALSEYLQQLDHLERRLAEFRYTIDRQHGELIRGVAHAQEHEPVSDIQRRLRRARSQSDAALVIGTAKELVEAVAKDVLADLGKELSGKEEFPGLVHRAHKALELHASQMDGDSRVGRASQKVLSGIQQAVLGVNELRNLGGTGHGAPAKQRVSLHMRHAHLAAGAAEVWAQMMRDTLSERRDTRMDGSIDASER